MEETNGVLARQIVVNQIVNNRLEEARSEIAKLKKQLEEKDEQLEKQRDAEYSKELAVIGNSLSIVGLVQRSQGRMRKGSFDQVDAASVFESITRYCRNICKELDYDLPF